MAASIGDVMVMPGRAWRGIAALRDPFFLRDNDFASRSLVFHPGGQCLGRIGDAGHFFTVAGGGDQ